MLAQASATSAQHESDSDDLDYVPGDEDHGMAFSRVLFREWYSATRSAADSDDSDERDSKRPRTELEGPSQTPEELAIARRCGMTSSIRYFL